jgi:ferredoxin--NADP+ reductase
MTDQSSATNSSYAVAVIGGACAGTEVAHRLAQRGITVVVLEQNPRPFGKIEDGLPRWHAAQRNKEYGSIEAKLSHELIHFVPNTKIGRDLDFADLAQNWGFNAVILACGAWSDRKLAVDGAEAFVGKGLVYQNPFLRWFNHYLEKDYDGPQYDIHEGAIVVGGGLASIDMLKIINLELACRALKERGIEVSTEELEHKGIPKALAEHDLTWEDLGLKACTLVYRRRIEDMPVMSAPEGADEARLKKVEAGRVRMVDKAQKKFLFNIEQLATPEAILSKDGQLTGLTLRRTRMENGRPVATDESFDVETPLVISSIGSVPDPIAGIEMKGDLFAFTDWDLGTMEDYPTVFGAGNVVTGKGNIIASRKHAGHIAQHTAESYLGLNEDGSGGFEISEGVASGVGEAAEAMADQIQGQSPISSERLASILEKVSKRQGEINFGSGIGDWLARNKVADED